MMEITLTKKSQFIQVSLKDCIIDDVTNVPFPRNVFFSCHFDNVKFKSDDRLSLSRDCFFEGLK